MGICVVSPGTLCGTPTAPGLANWRPTAAGLATRCALNRPFCHTEEGTAFRMKGCWLITAAGGTPLRIWVKLAVRAKLLIVVMLILVTRDTKGKDGPKAKKARWAKGG